MSLRSCFEYTTFTKKCEEFLIVLHDFYAQFPERVFVRDINGTKMPFVWVTAPDFIRATTYQKNSFYTTLKFLVDNGIVIVIKPDFVKRKTTNCYAINYAMLDTCLKHWGYTPVGIRPHSDKLPLTDICKFDPMEIISKVPGFKQRRGRYTGRKCIQNPKGNCKPRALLENRDAALNRHFQTKSNPLRGYLYHIGGVADVDNSRLHTRLRFEGARYATLCQKEGVDSLGQLIYTMGIVLEEQVVKGAIKGFASVVDRIGHYCKRWVDIGRPDKYFQFIGEIFKRQIFQPTRENFIKLAAWIKEHCRGNLTEGLKFKNLYAFSKTLINFKKGYSVMKNSEKTEKPPLVFKSKDEKIEELQYEIAFDSHETRQQKEARLQLLSHMGPDDYAAWVKDLPFDGESDYCFSVKTEFHKNYLNNRYSYDIFKYDIPRYTLQLYR